MADFPQSMEENPQNSAMQYSQFQSGNMMLDMIMGMLMGNNFAPRPTPGSGMSVMDIYNIRQQTQDRNRINAMTFANNQIMHQMQINGLQTNPNSMLGRFLGNPNSIVSQLLAPIIGGNPGLAANNIYTGMNGMAMGAFGRTQQIGMQDTMGMFNAVSKQFYGGPNGSINYQATRGFNIEDFTSAITRGAQLNMFSAGGTAGNRQGIGEVSGGVMKNAAGAMDAVRSMTGLTKGGDIMNFLNEFIGTNAVDLNDSGSAKKVEDLLRNVKATAKQAGVSINAMMGMINEGKELARAYGSITGMNLGLGGEDIARISTNAITQAQAMGAMPGSANYMRQHGGTAGLAQDIQAKNIEMAGQPIATQLQTLYAHFDQQGNKSATAKILAFANSGANVNASSYNSLVNELGALPGESAVRLNVLASDPNAFNSISGLHNAFTDTQSGAAAALGAFRGNSGIGGYFRNMSSSQMAQFRAAFNSNGGNTAAALVAAGAPPGAIAFALKGGSVVDQSMQLEMHPEMAQKMAAIKAAQATQASQEAAIAKVGGVGNASLLNILSQTLLGGNLGGISDLLKGIKGDSITGKALAYTKALSAFGNGGSAEEFIASATEAGATLGISATQFSALSKDIGNRGGRSVKDLLKDNATYFAMLGVKPGSAAYKRLVSKGKIDQDDLNSLLGNAANSSFIGGSYDEVLKQQRSIENAAAQGKIVDLGNAAMAAGPGSEKFGMFQDLTRKEFQDEKGNFNEDKFQDYLTAHPDQAAKLSDEHKAVFGDNFSAGDATKAQKQAEQDKLKAGADAADTMEDIASGLGDVNNTLMKLVDSLSNIGNQ